MCRMQYLPLEDILKENGHSNATIFYLKMDIEGYELDGLPVWLKSGSFKNVQQFGIEIHATDNEDTVRKLLASVQELYRQKFRLISFEVNACSGRPRSKYYAHIEVVFKRQQTSNVTDFCDKGISSKKG
jgi:hypothetical protein